MKNLLSKFAGGIDKSDDPPIEFVCDEKYYSVVPEPTPAFDVLPRLKTRESHGTAPLSWDITVRGSRPVLVG